MAAPHEIAAYRDAGHSVAETCAHFGIKDRAVYKACQIARSHQAIKGDVERPVTDREQHRSQSLPASEASKPDTAVPPTTEQRASGAPSAVRALAHFPDVATDHEIAGETTYWKCPVTGELLPVIPGMGRKSWNAERIALHQRLALLHTTPAPARQDDGTERAPAPAPVPSNIPSQSESAPAPAPDPDVATPAVSTDAPPVHQPAEPIVIVKRYPLPTRPARTEVGWVAVHEYLPPPNIILALAVVAILILLCSW